MSVRIWSDAITIFGPGSREPLLTPVQRLLTANQNFAPSDATKPRRKLTLEESLARSKVRYAKTLAYLSKR